MIERNPIEINWTAALIGFGVDWTFSELVGLVVMAVMLLAKGVSLDSEGPLPSDVMLVRQFVGVLGAAVGGLVAGYIAQRKGALHGVLGSVIGLLFFLCAIPLLGDTALTVGDLGFIVLNLVAAGYGGQFGERWRARRKKEP
jgi:hypothetical protein